MRPRIRQTVAATTANCGRELRKNTWINCSKSHHLLLIQGAIDRVFDCVATASREYPTKRTTIFGHLQFIRCHSRHSRLQLPYPLPFA